MSSSSSDESNSSSEDEAPPLRGKTLRPPESDDPPSPAASVRPPANPRGKELRLVQAKKPAKKKTAVKKKRQTKKKETAAAAAYDSDSVAVAVVVESDDDVDAVVVQPAKRKRDSKKKKKTSTAATTSVLEKVGSKVNEKEKKIAPEQIQAAETARSNLCNQVTFLPYRISDRYVVRSFGRIHIPRGDKSSIHSSGAKSCIGSSNSGKSGSKSGVNSGSGAEEEGYSSPHALYPIGYSCDRYEFSPIHGRMVKVRCEILDGGLLKHTNSRNNNNNNKSGGYGEGGDGGEKGGDRDGEEPNLIEEDLGSGPIFRVMWGPGIEADVDTTTFPFDPTVNTMVGGAKKSPVPLVGMCVSVKFDGNVTYEGKITRVSSNSKKSSSVKAVWNICILYEDGVVENTNWPDEDIVLYPPGYPPIQQTTGYVTELHGKPVHTVLAKTPLEAWGKTLLSLGLIDEIIYEQALQTVHKSREEALEEARDRIESANKKRRDDRSEKRQRQTRNSEGVAMGDEEGNTNNAESKATDNDGDVTMNPEEPEPPTEQEIALLQKLKLLKQQLTSAKADSRSLSVSLSNARISSLTPFAANPFLSTPDSTSQDASLMTAAVKKEKSKMGNTGNKRKVVTPATMLDRSDTFFTPEIEKLIEGLPDSECAPLYVFHANRSSPNQAWAYEAKIRHENALQKKLEKERRAEEEAEAKERAEVEKAERKRVKEEEVRAKKRQRDEEEEQKKRERVEKRLTQLTLQMDERLAKESYFSNERALMSYVRALNKEFGRRRKVADIVIAHKMDQALPTFSDNRSTAYPAFIESLPPLSNRLYDEAAVRIWDFLHCFSDAFVTDGSNSLPALDSLQDAFDDLNRGSGDSKKYSAAVALVESIAIMLCKAISPGLTKYLAASAYQSEGNKGATTEESACFPVNELTWREVARMSLIGDLLIDLGYSKNESANIVKGYRSGGHPNSKEAKRWKKIEDSSVVMLYQQLNDESNEYRRRIVTAQVSAPSTPSCSSSDWRYFLHNIRSKSPNSVTYIKENVEKSLSALKKEPNGVTPDAAQTCISELETCLSILKQTPSGHSADPDLLKAKKLALDVLDSTRGKPSDIQQKLKAGPNNLSKEPPRQRMGLLKNYELTREQYRSLELAKEDYMVAALKLKEELENKNKDDDAANLSDEEEDEDEAETSGAKSDAESKPDAKPDEPTETPMAEPSSIDSMEIDTLKQEPSTQEEVKSDVDAESKPDIKPDERMDTPTAEPSSNDTGMEMETETVKQEPSTKEEVKSDVDAESKPDIKPDEPMETPKAEPSSNDTSMEIDTVKQEPSTQEEAKVGDSDTINKDGEVKQEAAGDTSRLASKGQLNEELVEGKTENIKVESKPGSPKLADESFIEKKSDAEEKSSNTHKNSSSEVNEEVNTTQNDIEPCGASSDYEFCADIQTAPEIIRRCLAVVRTLCSSNSADPFIYPVDPQLYPGYYESVISPMSLFDIGNFLQKAGQDPTSNVELIVLEFARKVRKIFQNSLAYNTGNKEHLTMNSAEEMLRLFERLFFDWVLAPSKPALKDLDDDKCIDSHDSDMMSMVILCDCCEAKYNMTRLKPPLLNVPTGEWYCPRCISGRCWATIDPRIGRQVQNSTFSGTVESCKFIIADAEETKYSIIYCISDKLGSKQFWALEDVDKAIIGEPVAPVTFLDALAECPGYSFGRDAGILGYTLPLNMDPFVDDKAAQSALSSPVYQDTVVSCISLMHPPDNLSQAEWVKLLLLLVAKCSSSDTVLELSTNLENKEASNLASAITTFWRARGAKNIVPDDSFESDDESVSSQEATAPDETKSESTGNMIIENTSAAVGKDVNDQNSNEVPNDVKMNEEGALDKPTISPEEELRRRKRESVLFAKTIRQKKREEALVGYYVQHSLKPTVSSFDQDPLSSLINSAICNQEDGVNAASVRCRELCHFCHLSDVAICSPMCRVPNDAEWREIFPHAVHEKNSYLIAQMPSPAIHTEDLDTKPIGKVCMVRVRVGGELVTSKAKSLDYPSKILDQPLTQFLPRNIFGFQSELRFREESNLSVVSGSLTAHEVCGIAVHRMRKEHFLRDRREHCKASLGRDAAISCGKSIPIGQDQWGRSYWLFKAEPKSLFVCESSNSTSAKWHRYSTPEAISSVIVGLGKDPPSESLKEAYPEAADFVKERIWPTLLMQKALSAAPTTAGDSQGVPQHGPAGEKEAKSEAPFVEDEDVLVESMNGSILWDAVVVDVSKDPMNGQVNGYLVHFKGWSSRFDSWVPRDRVVESNPENLGIQKEVIEELRVKQAMSPNALQGMCALKILQQTNWKNSKYLSPADMFEFVCSRPSASQDEKSLLLLKGSILLIEAALPVGAIEYWPAHAALLWRNFVKHAKGPESLLKCVLLLEDAISPDSLRPQATQLLSALPRQWRAMGEASVSSVALRVAVLDHSIKYGK